jgi:hypothetical protein
LCRQERPPLVPLNKVAQTNITALSEILTVYLQKSDAYFIKGSAMFGNSTLDKAGKYIAPEGTSAAQKNYLKLAPEGAHAKDVKEMLKMIETP